MLTVSGTGANLDNHIGGFEVGLVDNGIADTRVLQNMLAKVLVETEDVCVGGAALGRFTVVGATAGPSTLLFGRFGHDIAVDMRGAGLGDSGIFAAQHQSTFAHRIGANIFWSGRKKDPAKGDKITRQARVGEATPLAKNPSRERGSRSHRGPKVRVGPLARLSLTCRALSGTVTSALVECDITQYTAQTVALNGHTAALPQMPRAMRTMRATMELSLRLRIQPGFCFHLK